MITKKKYNGIAVLVACTMSFIVPNATVAQKSAISNSKDSFVEVSKDFPIKEKNLRKWDAPVVADLDQDGYPDLLINDHGYGVQVCWNNKGKFEKPFDIL